MGHVPAVGEQEQAFLSASGNAAFGDGSKDIITIPREVQPKGGGIAVIVDLPTLVAVAPNSCRLLVKLFFVLVELKL